LQVYAPYFAARHMEKTLDVRSMLNSVSG